MNIKTKKDKKIIERLSITQEVTINIVGVFFIMIILLGFIVAQIFILNNEKKLSWQKEANLSMATTFLKEPLWTLDLTTINNTLSTFFSDSDQVVGIQVKNEYDEVVAKKMIGEVKNVDFEKLKLEKNNSVVLGEISRNGQKLGIVEFIYSTDAFIHETVEQVIWLCSILFIVGGLFANITLWRLKKTITKPIERIVKGSQMIASGNYDFQVEDEYVVEFQELAKTLNLAINAIRERNQNLKDNLERVKIADNAKSMFVSTISHEIRTPLNAIIGLTDLSLSGDLPADQKKNLKMVKLSADSLLTIINDILDYSKIEANKVSIDNVKFDFKNVIAQSVEITTYLVEQKKLNLYTEMADEDYTFTGDPLRIRQVLVNLLNNAVKFTPTDGSVGIKLIKIKDEINYSVIRVEVIDTGIGIEEADIETLFEAFNQIDQSRTRKYGGTGLGLSICKRLVELMDGVIGVESKAHHGSKFWFQLRLKKVKN